MSTLTIGKLAAACGVKIDTVRYYERMSLLLPIDRTESGYRIYSLDSIKRLQFVRKAQTLGFTLEEIKNLLELSEKPDVDCSNVRDYATSKIAEVDDRIADLLKIKDCLKELSAFCPGKGKALSECNILQYFYGEDK